MVTSELGFNRRPLTPGQVTAWAELISAVCTADADNEILTEADLLEEFDEPLADFDRGSVAIYDGATMIGFSLIMLRRAPDQEHELRQWGKVHPGYRGTGVGTELLTWSEEAAQVLHHERYPGKSLSVNANCLVKCGSAMALFEACGYRQVRWFHEMTKDLSADLPSYPACAGVSIVPFTAENSADAMRVRNAAFRDHWGSTDTTRADWDLFVGGHAFRPGYSFLGYSGDEPLGFVLGSEYEGYNEASGTRDLYINLVGTTQSARKRGVATTLIGTAISAAKADGFDTASLNVDADSPTGALGLYERLGFTVIDTRVTQRKPLYQP
jgi:mycothiol synthase